MAGRYYRGRKLHSRPRSYSLVDLRLGGQSSHTIIYPRVACAVARWVSQQRIRNQR